MRVSLASRIVKGVVLTLITVVLLIPLYFILITAFKPPAEYLSNPLGLPSRFYIDNFVNAFVQGKIGNYVINSFITVFASLIGIIVLDTMCAYGLSKTMHRLPGRIVYIMITAGMMIGLVGYVTMILLYQSLGLYNSLLGVVIAFIASSVPHQCSFYWVLLTGCQRMYWSQPQ